MTNSLSEQVAGLERQIAEVWDIAEAWKLNSERHWKRVEELEKERDRLKADAISDLIKRHWLENQVRNREAERDELQRQVQEARDEVDALRAGQGWWPGGTISSEDVPFKGMSDLRYKEPEDDFPCCSSKPTGYADDDQDAEVSQRHDPAPRTAETMRALGDWRDRVNAALRSPRLTVHDLEVAPVGSVVRNARGIGWRKVGDGRWIGALGLQGFTGTEILGHLHADATLTHPKEDQ